MSLVDDSLACPQCGTTRSTNPRLVLRYASCCGHCRCEDCIELLFAQAATQSTCFPCPECSTPISIKDFDLLPIETQRYTAEVKHRSRLNKLMGLTPSNFMNDEQQYNDFLEFKQDIVFDLTEGTKEDIKAAEERLADFIKQNAARIEAANTKRQQISQPGGLAAIAEGEYATGPLVPIHRVPVFTLPQFVPTMSLLRTIDEELRSISDEHERRTKLTERAALLVRAKVAGGFRPEYAQERDRQAMYEGFI